jgi:hypothetical protein
MPDSQKLPSPPRDLRKRGKALWRSIFQGYIPNPTETQILHDLCRTLDEIDVLTAVLADSDPVVTGSTGQPRANPLLAELREHRKLADRLALALAVPTGVERIGRRQTPVARQAAATRWQRRAA